METLRPQYVRLNEGIVFLHVTKDGTIECESYEDILSLMQNYSLIEIWRKTGK